MDCVGRGALRRARACGEGAGLDAVCWLRYQGVVLMLGRVGRVHRAGMGKKVCCRGAKLQGGERKLYGASLP